ncbi:unnamed protein product, partial [Mesorhabditis belari]|uniref:Uncharacterized protein n=1 Tax=Mesorhabditis belari TaxID=2138241 RepID=A0AAF3EZ75_9BILA
MFSKIFSILLVITPLWTSPTPPTGNVPVTPEINPGPTTNACECPVIPDLQSLECILDWISHVNILKKETKTVNGTTFNQFSIQHLQIFKGVDLPNVLIVPEGPCGLELEADVQYLLSGLLTGESNLYAGLCLQILNGVVSPVWTLVDEGLIVQLLNLVGNLVCNLLEGLLGPILDELITIPSLLNGITKGGLTGDL